MLQTDNPLTSSSSSSSSTPDIVFHVDDLLIHDDDFFHRRRLELIHIPRTGGTVLENEAADHGILWGRCHFYCFKQRIPTCPLQGQGVLPRPSPNLGYRRVSWWHFPVHLIEAQAARKGLDYHPYDTMLAQSNKNDSNNDNNTQTESMDPKVNYPKDFVVVVRNPYAKAISAYLMNPRVTNRQQAIEGFNQRVQIYVDTNKSWYDRQFFFPQYDYVFDDKGKQRVRHVLRMEDGLKRNVDALAEAYDLPIRAPTHKPSWGSTQSRQESFNLTVHDLYPHVLQRFNEYYRLDFETFGYTMIHPDSTWSS